MCTFLGLYSYSFLFCCSRAQGGEPPATEGQHYCVDENTERRNHYLDLAGIENYTSRFEGKCLFILFYSLPFIVTLQNAQYTTVIRVKQG